MHPHQHGTLAQLVEQWTENPCVPGSNPGGTTKNPNRNIRVFYWLKFPNFHVSYLGETFATVFIALKINYPINFHQNIEFGSGRAVHYIFAATHFSFHYRTFLQAAKDAIPIPCAGNCFHKLFGASQNSYPLIQISEKSALPKLFSL